MLRTLRTLPRDVRLLFSTRLIRLFGFGLASIILVLYLSAVGLAQGEIGLLLTLTLIGDALISLVITSTADRLGRRRMLVVGAGLMVFSGALFAVSSSFLALVIAATLGVISPSGNEVGPFLAIEQAALTEEIAPDRRVSIFAWYNLVGSFATALGALAGGSIVQLLQVQGVDMLSSYRLVLFGYSLLGVLLGGCFLWLSPACEAPVAQRATQRPAYLQANLGLGRSRSHVFKLAGLFSADAFAGGFVVQAYVAWWFHHTYGVPPAILGGIFFGANILAGISALSANWLCQRIGLLATMVGTHIPSNVLLILVPLMPNLPLAIVMLLARFSISQMDVPTRQAYTMALVTPSERSAAAGLTGIARTLGASLSPLVAGPLYASAALSSLPFLIAGGLKIVYDLAVWQVFRRVALPPAEARAPRTQVQAR